LKTAGIVLAAGLSRRMQQFKPLLKLGEEFMLIKSVKSLLLAGAFPVLVVTGREARRIEELLSSFSFPGVAAVFNRDYAAGDMLASVRVALTSLKERRVATDSFFVLPGDIPLVQPATLERIKDAFDKAGTLAAVPVYCGRGGHPPLLAAACLDMIINYQAGGGLRGFLGSLGSAVKAVAVDDEAVRLDADTPDDYAKLCAYYYRIAAGR
jgi:molybdenum cofactor cytidylyltransferase